MIKILAIVSLMYSSMVLSDEAQEKKEIEYMKKQTDKEIKVASNSLFGVEEKNKFSIYEPSYLIVGKENLKMQFSGKYRLSQNLNLYLAYSQLMFWSIYENSAPFDDINYKPEAFYRIIERDLSFLKSIDIGMQHVSNGEDEGKSRSYNNVYLKANMFHKYRRHNIFGEVKAKYVYSKSDNNDDIVDYIGYWEAKLIFSHILVSGSARMDLELKAIAGKSIINFSKGGREVGLVYYLGSKSFNPGIYAQYYSGYAESLLHYNQKTNQVRAGLLLFF